MIKRLESPMEHHFYLTYFLIYESVRNKGTSGEEAYMESKIRFQDYIIDFLIQNHLETNSIVRYYEKIRNDKRLKEKLDRFYESSKKL